MPMYSASFASLKNFRAKDRAPLGHALMAWGFFVFVLFYFFFFILAEGFGLTGLENTNFLFYFAWVMDFMAVFVIIGAGWGLIRRFIVRPDRLKGEQTIEALIILLSVFTHPFAYLFNQATVIAMGAPPAGLGHSLLPPVSAWLSHLFTGSTPVYTKLACRVLLGRLAYRSIRTCLYSLFEILACHCCHFQRHLSIPAAHGRFETYRPGEG